MEIDYIALFVVDVERSLIFYRDVLGFIFDKPTKIDSAEGYSGKLKIGLYDRLWLAKLFGDRGEQPISGNPFLLSMSVDNLDQVYEQISGQISGQICGQIGDRQTAIPIDIISPPQIMPWGQKILFLRDPDGNLVEIVQSRAYSALD